ncbi:MAG: hypothetical protein Q8M77_13860 [Hydrogenophaga sp.]|uniref:hypothetical protein n=1 Tax=Hydrogenophaga sp. TaxID=1904254 RepID=UPI0027316F1A|nr:hypothetical protein [Hydrogenophaga sp.]MDP2015497.1 hypothetical protein [Hydrogenophaga sp.]MDP3252984.1 hypothetical protein [Hydrogenophaga sp.]
MIPFNASFEATPLAQLVVLDDDLQQIASTIHADHDPELINVASTQLLCNHLLEHYAQNHGRSVAAMVRTLARMVDAYAQERGYSAFDLMAAKTSIEQAGQSLAYISAIPSDASIAAAASRT